MTQPDIRRQKQELFYIGAAPNERHRLVWFPIETRQKHLFIVGATGSGKSYQMADLIMQDFTAGRGLAVIDPKGDLIETVLACIALLPESEWTALVDSLILIDPADPECTAGFNPLETSDYASASRQRQDLVSTWRRVFAIDETQMPRLMLVLRRALALAMEFGLTIGHLPRLLTDADFRDRLVSASANEDTRRFWTLEFPSSKPNQQQWTASTLTRLEVLLDDPTIRRFLGQAKSTFNFRRIMDEGKTCLISTAKGRLGQETSGLLSGFLLTQLQLAAESRASLAPEARRPFYLYVDEFANFATPAFEDLLAEARGLGTSLVVAHQQLAQLPDSLRHAILTNAYLRMVFRCSHDDSRVLSEELFRVSGQRVKDRELKFASLAGLPLPYTAYSYFSAGEESRQNRDLLHHLPDRMMAVHVADEPAPYLLRTVDLPVADLARAKGRVAALKRLLYSQHALAPAVDDRLVTPAAPPVAFNWNPGSGRQGTA